jgi:alpha-tubulin suppressor-like RCC1 family protein
VGQFSDWISVSAGGSHSLALRANGTAWAWGLNSSGRLGDNTTVSKSSPVSVVGGFSDWLSVSGGGAHSLGVRANGSAWTWGSNTSGQLGDQTTVAKSSPVSVMGGFSDWVSVNAGGYHTVGLTASGMIWSWGNNEGGRLGDGTTVAKSSPVSITGGLNNWLVVSAGGFHSLAIRNGA